MINYSHMANESEIAVIQEISSVIVHERNVEALLKEVLAVLDRKMGMLRGTFTFRHGNELTIEASQGLDEAERKLGHYKIGEGITGHVAETGRPHVINDIRTDRRFLNRTKSRDYKEPVAFICVPILHQDEVIGTLSIDRKIDEHTVLERDCSLLEIVGNITADAVFACRRELEERESLLEENRKLRELILPNPGELVGNCREMRQVYEAARQVAPSDATVLIRGASGTGKELLARAIIAMSPRRDKPVIALNCAALPDNLVESELFGCEKGAFTGASARRIGRAEAADGGTLFLDEIGDLSLPTQVKLLRFLQEKTFSRLGSNEELHSDVRFIVATSRNLEELMSKKQFREDLYYRLNIFPIMMPDLKNRRSDILLLAEHFIAKMNVKYRKAVSRMSPTAVNLLMTYPWPGNVRELENCIERAVLTAQGDCIQGENLPPSLQSVGACFFERLPNPGGAKGSSLAEMVKNYERDIVSAALARNHGNISGMGRELGLSPRMAHYKLKCLGLLPSDHPRNA
ncbi:MAG: sigma 54-interacting transcriptional regulator [Victivallaceae bacterium]|nr:sigma 54-interacting transcriptional regulator [Victivallaceae bacterium]